jgi:molybdopterin synthase sulfur carrier subunit
MIIRFYATLRQVVGKKSDTFAYQPGCTLNTLLNQAIEKYPGLAQELYEEGGNLRGHIRIFINKKDLSYHRQFLEYDLGEDDEIDIFPAVSGGKG